MKNVKNYEKEIFKNKNASRLAQFVAYADKLPPKQREACYHYFYDQMFNGYARRRPGYRAFLVGVVRHDWVMYLYYAHSHTILGDLRCSLPDGKADAKLIYLNEKRFAAKMEEEEREREEERKCKRITEEAGERDNEDPDYERMGSARHFAFCFLLSFKFRIKPSVNALCNVFYRRPFFNEDIMDFLMYAAKTEKLRRKEDKEAEIKMRDNYKKRKREKKISLSAR